MKVSEIMNKAFVVESSMSLKNAAKIMSDKNIGSLIVLKKNEDIAGILTERDIMKNIGKQGNKISSVMSENVVTIEASDNVDNAAMIMAKNKIKRLPVVKNGKLVGIITSTDILANSNSINEDFFLD